MKVGQTFTIEPMINAGKGPPPRLICNLLSSCNRETAAPESLLLTWDPASQIHSRQGAHGAVSELDEAMVAHSCRTALHC
jgi:hypothetical protein